MTGVSIRRPLRALADLFRWVVFDAHIEMLEMWTSINGIIWGAWLLNPWMNVFTQTNIYSTMAKVPEWMWGAVALLAGCMQIQGRLMGQPRLIQYGARTLAGLWMFGAAALAVSNWRFASIITYPMMACASLLVSHRAAVDRSANAPRRIWGR